MEIHIRRDFFNPLLRRREISFLVGHDSSPTPKLYDVRKAIASRYGVQEEVVYIRKLKTLTGTTMTSGEAEVYDSEEDAKTILPTYIIARNMVDRRKESRSKETGKDQTAKQRRKT
ncbi:MAG: 7-cyano-7-deazaguanine synthase [Candidatus Bathyarchaeia archaeon]